MKSIKLLLFLLVTVGLFNCNDNKEERPIFVLSKANLVGTYELENLVVDTKTTTEVSGFPVVVNSNSIGSLFQVDLTFKSNDTYSIQGEYAVKTTIHSAGNQPVVNEEIIVLNESGRYNVDNTDNTISFINEDSEFLKGNLIVSDFSEDKIALVQMVEEMLSLRNTLVETNLNISFLRKE